MDDERTYSISGLNRAIGKLIARHTPAEGFWVRGEIQRLSLSRNGHCYFDLVERDPRRSEPKSAAAALLWSNRREEVGKSLDRFGLALAEDLSVRVLVRVAFYEPAGKVQLEVLDIDPAFTVGDLAASREQVRRALAAAGLLEANRRLAVPLVPLAVALVTSGGSAAYHDFTQELSTSGYAFSVSLFDTRVTGPGAAGDLAAALRRAARDADLVVMVRGGGARHDLSAFDSELVARAVATSPVPVWVGVGHEIDRSICDEVANRCFKTPTAAAQALVATVAAFAGSLDELQSRIGRVVGHRLAGEGIVLERTARHLRGAAAATLAGHDAGLERSAATLRRAPERHLVAAAARLDGLAAQVRALDPARVLARGFSITRDASGEIVRAADTLNPGDRIATTVAGGSFGSVVEAGTIGAGTAEEAGEAGS